MKLDSTRLLAASALLFCASCQAPRQQENATVDGDTGAPAHAELNAPEAIQDPQDPEAQARLNQARARALVRQYLQSASELMSRGGDSNLEAARLELIKAKELDPNNAEIDQKLNAVAAGLDQPVGLPGSFAEEQARLTEINEQRARARVQSLLDSARGKLEQQNYGGAIEDIEKAELNITVGNNIDWGGLESETSGLKTQATQARDTAEREDAEAVRRRIASERRAAETAAEARRKARVDNLMAKAVRAFEQRSFDLCRDLAFEAMTVDSTHQMARDLHNAAIKASREARSDKYYRDMANRLRQLKEASEDLRVPQMDVLHIDPEVWEIANARGAGTSRSATIDPDTVALKRRLGTTKLSDLRFTEEDGTYDEVKTRIQTITDIPIIITPGAREVIDGEGLVLEMDIISPISVENLLDQMAARSAELAWTVRDGVVQFTSTADAGGDVFQDIYDVRDLVFAKTVFLPPTIRDIPSGDGESDQPRTGGQAEDPQYYIQIDELGEQIKNATGLEYWEGDSGAEIDSAEAGYLLVTANDEMHGQVKRVLDDLRRFATTVVTVESKFLQVSQNFLQEIGVDFRGLGGSGSKGTVAQLDDITNGLDDNASRGLDNSGTADPAGNPSAGAFFNDGGDGDIRSRTENFFGNSLGRNLTNTGGLSAAVVFINDLELSGILQAVEKRSDVEELNGQNLTVLNNERGHVAVINQTAYVRDFDVEVAQAAFIADPKIDVIQDGVVLDVQPTVGEDRKRITLHMQPTVAELVRPIPTFSTSLAGTTQPVTVQLPQLLVRSFATTITVPDGGSVLIGGLREVLTQERRAEVPLLGKIPLLSFFFKQEGIADENSSLMVLVRASITDVKDLMDGI